MSFIRTRTLCAVLWLALSLLALPAMADETPSFSRDIQPILSKHCLICHGPDEAEAGLRLDSAEIALSELDSGATAIVAGNVAGSDLIHRVSSTDADLRMPPEGDPLSGEEVALLKRWIEQGAKFEVHWAYRPVAEPTPPRVSDESWIRRPLDRYVLARLDANGYLPSPHASRAKLIRRLYYDLIGLPPTPEEVDAFLADDSPDAFESLVDRLLASQHFGERWGRHWLDKARYADSDGYEKDRPRPNAWRYRDWVIEAINRDMPFDQFTIEQLAGDLLPEASASQRLATAFHRQTLTNTEGGTDQEEFRVEATFDRTETTSAVWMALTMTCARCHTHKYDSITQTEYYELFAFFNNANEANANVPKSEAAIKQFELATKSHEAKVADLTTKLDAAKRAIQPETNRWISDMTAKLTGEEAADVKFSVAKPIEATATSKAVLTAQDDASVLVSGPTTDKDKYTLVFELPDTPLTGLRIETLTDETLPSKGPGRTAHGNFVLTQLRAYVGNDPDFDDPTKIELAEAEADFAQQKFAPGAALTDDPKTGWAISPQMSKPHVLTAYFREPLLAEGRKYLQVVLDQQYGTQHTIGKFRVSTMTGFDPLRALPFPVANALRVNPADRSDAQDSILANHFAATHEATRKLVEQLAALEKQAPQPPTMSVRVMAPANRVTKLLHRGDFLQPADVVSSDALAVVSRTHPLDSRRPDASADRLDLAYWLVDENHPLTARVTVNQVWAHLFGRGIVPTLNDFGVRGDLPTHPELLDALAWSFPRDMGWSRKALIKEIVMSATYRQASDHRAELAESDPTNRLFARQNRVRVEAEIIRDLNLAVGGLLSEKIGGPSVFPPLPPGVAELSYANNFKWQTSKGEDAYRRGLYTFFKRTSPHPTLINFDCPDSNTTRLARDSSNTPLQALATLNNDVYTEAAQGLARRVLSRSADDDTAGLTYALRLCIAREPSAAEVDRFAELLIKAREYYHASADDAKRITSRHRAEGVAVEENAAWVATTRMILNLDEFIVRD